MMPGSSIPRNPIFGGQSPQGSQYGGAYGGAEQTLAPYAQAGQNAIGGISDLENQFDNPEQAFNNFAQSYSVSPGAHNKLMTGMDAVRNAMAAHGLSGSGAEAEALTHYTQGVINQDMNEQYNNILNGGKLGLDAGGTLYHGGLEAGGDIAQLQEAEEQQKEKQKQQNKSDLWSGIGTAASIGSSFL